MTDIDVIYKIPFEPKDSDFVFAHYEDILFPVYPDPNFLIKKENIFDEYPFKWDKFAVNTSFLYFNNQKFLNDYTSKACEYMEYKKHADYSEKYRVSPHNMAFIEQRFLGELLAHYKITDENFNQDYLIKDIYVYERTGHFFPNRLDESNYVEVSEYYEHLWGHKHLAKDDFNVHIEYMLEKLKELYNTFPDDYDMVLNIIRNAVTDKHLKNKL